MTEQIITISEQANENNRLNQSFKKEWPKLSELAVWKLIGEILADNNFRFALFCRKDNKKLLEWNLALTINQVEQSLQNCH